MKKVILKMLGYSCLMEAGSLLTPGFSHMNGWEVIFMLFIGTVGAILIELGS